LYSSTTKVETENKGESMADYNAAPLATVSIEFNVLCVSDFPKIYLEISKMMGVRVASPIISIECI
jgi:hypothetical protein